eukprot:COSAG05_NODE_21932_length_268_cov_0.615385_1_plen_49_part_01
MHGTAQPFALPEAPGATLLWQATQTRAFDGVYASPSRHQCCSCGGTAST